MANNDTKNKISIATYGVGTRLDDESNKMSDIVRQTTLEVANKFGKRFDNKVIDSYTNLNLSNLFVATEKKSVKKAENEVNKFKEMMQDNSANAIQMLTAEQGRVLNYANYKSIVDNIPECALALDTYISNILSPDDYSKNIFTIEYDSSDKAVEEKVNNELKALVKKYKIEDKTEEIVSNTLTYGDCFVSVLPYDREIAKFLAQTSDTNLNESEGYDILDETYHLTERTHMNVLTEEMVSEAFTQEEISILSEAIGEKDTVSIFLNAVNNNIKIKSVTDLLKSKAMADNDIIFSKSDIEIGKDKPNKPKDPKAMAINGAAIKILEPERVVSLDIGGVCYGYYYVEPGYGAGAETPYNANNAKMYAQTSNPMNPSLQPQPTGDTPGEGAANPIAKNLNVSDEKLQLLSQVLLKAISKKLNKEYVSDNKQFKDLLYNLLKQKYIFEKGISITYFMPEEVIHFAANSIFEKIVFFAKIYLAVLTNTVIIKMGRGHDKRVFYVNAGPDNNHEQAIMQVIQDVKTKEFKMSNLGSISSILSLNPGIFDDIQDLLNE